MLSINSLNCGPDKAVMANMFSLGSASEGKLTREAELDDSREEIVESDTMLRIIFKVSVNHVQSRLKRRFKDISHLGIHQILIALKIKTWQINFTLSLATMLANTLKTSASRAGSTFFM